jgi:hypothetical protein
MIYRVFTCNQFAVLFTDVTNEKKLKKNNEKY